MISTKTIIGVVFVAILIGVLYVTFEKNFLKKSISDPGSSPAQELGKQDLPRQSPSTNLPTPEPTLPPITESSDLLNEASSLEMRDYSSYFEGLKDKTRDD